ncbi:MAG: hypothetical protein IPG57_02065 [Burkholderiales bacterium]|nr:hypothetical protein [Burkholderiales bacterium]
MRQSLTFVHPVTLTSRDVRVGPDHLLVVAGALCGLVRLADAAGGLGLPWFGYAAFAAVAHLRLWRHAASLPVLGSLALATVSFGVSAFFSGMLINGLIAQRLRDAGWKIRNTDGQLGEYSSRFLAVDRLGFSEDDLMDAVVRRHLQPELIGGGEFDAPAASAAPTGRPAAAVTRTARLSATAPQD